MELKEFAYELPHALIAEHPTENRAAARLMVVRRGTGEIAHSQFSLLSEFLDPGDLLVLNDTKVFPARLWGRKESGGDVEVLLLEPYPHQRNHWIALLNAAKKPQLGSRILFPDGVDAEVIGDLGKGRYGVRFHYQGEIMDLLEKLGEPPLPPYIHRNRDIAWVDWERYQTVYAACSGSVAAPTAGFHFTKELLADLEVKGVQHAFVTLHVGPGTFTPVREERVERHHMEGERYTLSVAAADKIRRTRENGKKVIAVGSTTTRTLEWVARRRGRVETDEGIARLFIYPGERFQVIDGLITNFHLPCSTPLVLVAAFAGVELVRRVYQEAIRFQYRFYSYGDAMLVL